MEAEAFLDSLTLGTWLPNVDLCETNELYTVRVELPGVDLKDVSLTIRDAVVRVSGVKREPNVSQKLLCYYCLERRYGKFLREINLESVVDARRATAQLDNGVLIVELPKLVERRGRVLEIPIVRKKG
jgi:HSP20 family protein